MAQDVQPGPPQVFQCQNCLEFINTALTNCSYCGVVLDPNTAASAAQAQSIVAQACNEANILKILARAQALFFALSLIPFIPGVFFGFMILLIGVPALWIRWWIKYRNLQTADKDYEEAKRNTIVAAVIWSGVIVVWLLASVIQSWMLS